MTPLIRQDNPAAQDARVTAGGTLIRRYVLALPPEGRAGIEAAGTAAPVPPLSGGPGSHGSEATHAFTITDSVGGAGAQPLRGPGFGQPSCLVGQLS